MFIFPDSIFYVNGHDPKGFYTGKSGPSGGGPSGNNNNNNEPPQTPYLAEDTTRDKERDDSKVPVFDNNPYFKRD